MTQSIKPFILRSSIILFVSCVVVLCVYVYIQSLFMQEQPKEEVQTIVEEVAPNTP